MALKEGKIDKEVNSNLKRELGQIEKVKTLTPKLKKSLLEKKKLMNGKVMLK